MILSMQAVNTQSLTCVIPVSRMQNQLSRLSKTLIDCFIQNVYVVLVHDKQDLETGKQIVALEGFKQLSKAGMITYLEGSYNGPGPSRNAGLRVVSTRWLVFWDADDSPIVDEFIHLINAAEKIGAVSAFGSFQEIDFRSGVTLRTRIIDERSNVALGVGMNPGLWRWAFRTSHIGDHQFPEIFMGEDQLFLIQISPFSHRIYLGRNIVYKYSKNRQGQLTSNNSAINELRSAIIFFGHIKTKPENSNAKTFASTIIWKLILTRQKNSIKLLPNFKEIWSTFMSYQGKQIGFKFLFLGLIRVLLWKK